MKRTLTKQLIKGATLFIVLALLLASAGGLSKKHETNENGSNTCATQRDAVYYNCTLFTVENKTTSKGEAMQTMQSLNLEELEKQLKLIKTIEKIIYVEARGECLDGKIAVGASVINRLASEKFPDTIEEVLEGYANIKYITEKMLKRVPECSIATECAIRGEDPLKEILGGPTLFFYNPELSDKDEIEARKDIKVTYRIGNHIFYSEWK